MGRVEKGLKGMTKIVFFHMIFYALLLVTAPEEKG